MTPRTVLSSPILFVSVLFAVFSPVFSSNPDVLQRAPGQDVTLRCQVDGDGSIRAVEWTRPDLEPDCVLYFSDGHLDPTNQHPSFKDRVELVDRHLKDGNLSLILRNVRVSDSGTYECRVAKDGQSGRTKRADIDGDPIRRIQLVVTDSGFKNEDTTPTDGPQTITTTTDGPQTITTPTDGPQTITTPTDGPQTITTTTHGKNHNHVGLAPVLVLVCLVVVGSFVVVGVRKYKKQRYKDKQPEEPAADEAVGDQLI